MFSRDLHSQPACLARFWTQIGAMYFGSQPSISIERASRRRYAWRTGGPKYRSHGTIVESKLQIAEQHARPVP